MKSMNLTVLFIGIALSSACGMESPSEATGEIDANTAELLGKGKRGIAVLDGITVVDNRGDSQPTRRNVVKDVCDALADSANPKHDGLSSLLCGARNKAKAIVNGVETDPNSQSCGFRDTVCTDDNQQNRSNIDVHLNTCDSCGGKCESFCSGAGGCKKAYCGMIWCTMICVN